ncbi:hypothetical protein JVX98_13185 [Ensifer sp. PDNC004]|uniref:hypothetical protein n=1 Tax=Ensifer sp. PDNC004 TaxID=2811423 RepID=UPI001965D1E3|nr:hypothetical protein [Ensifer sp. PDNC004]QRY69169.1 hypothetical protein JVX98_13185 [Ensifer sp. PDNC004]
MAGPWEKYGGGVPTEAGPWTKHATASPKQEPPVVERGMLLPISKDAEGNVSFDSDSGLLGALKRVVMLPGEAMKGEIDPNSPEAIGRAAEFALTFSPINPAMRAGELAIPGVRNSLARADIDPPTAAALKAEAKTGFKAMRDSGVDYRAKAVEELARKIKGELETEGLIGEVAPKTHGVLDRLTSAPEGSVANISGLAAARKSFRQARKDFNNPSDQEAAAQAVGGLDEFISNPGAESVLSGSADEAAKLLRDANANWAASKRTGYLGGLETSAQRRAAAANSGQNLGNAIRQKAASALEKPRDVAGFNAAEKRAIEGVVQGDRVTNVTRSLSNMLGGGGGLGATAASTAGAVGGYMASGSPALTVAGAMLPLVGVGLRASSNRMTENALEEAIRLTAKRSPLYEKMIREAPLEAVLPSKTVNALRALILGTQQPNKQ